MKVDTVTEPLQSRSVHLELAVTSSEAVDEHVIVWILPETLSVVVHCSIYLALFGAL